MHEVGTRNFYGINLYALTQIAQADLWDSKLEGASEQSEIRDVLCGSDNRQI